MASVKEGPSCLRQTGIDSLQSFSWEILDCELPHKAPKAPTLHAVLDGCVDVRRKACKQRRARHNKNVVVRGICAAILLRLRNHHLNLVQRMISPILCNGHDGKQVLYVVDCTKMNKTAPLSLSLAFSQVYSRLQKMLLCLSHKRVLSTLDELGDDFDEKVLQWQCNLLSSMSVSYCFFPEIFNTYIQTFRFKKVVLRSCQ